MKKSAKNIIMTFIIIILSASLVYTVYEAKENKVVETPPFEMGNMPAPNANESGMQKPGNSTSNNEMNTPPEKPSGESENTTPPEKPNDSNSDDSSKPDMPSNDNSNSMPEMPSKNNEGKTSSESGKIETKYYILIISESLALSLIVIYLIMSKLNDKTFKETLNSSDKIIILILGTIVMAGTISLASVKIAENLSSNKEINNNESSNTQTYKTVAEITADKTLKSGEYSSENEDENAINVNGNIDVTLENLNVTKSGDSDGGDNTSFYGTNSAIIARDGANLTLKNITVDTSATGANGVFSYGGNLTSNNSESDGTTITIENSKITTTKDNSGGIMTTGGGKMIAKNLTINTSGTSSAAIRTDRGGGEVTVTGGTYTTTGKGSPSIYSTANITVEDATLASKKSEGIVIEGKNSVAIKNTKLTDTNNELNGKSTTYKNIFLYQSMSGDADEGKASFTALNSEIITNKGDSFYVTNTEAEINLTNSAITNNDKTGAFLRVQKDSWGTSGSNGGIVTLNMTKQTASGDIVVDEISELTMNLKENSKFTGSINKDKTAKSIKLVLDKTSSITLTKDTYVTSLENADSSNSNINFNGYKLYVNGKSIN